VNCPASNSSSFVSNPAFSAAAWSFSTPLQVSRNSESVATVSGALSPPPLAWHQCAVYSGNGNPAGKKWGVGNGEKDAQEGCCESAEEIKNLDQEEKRGDEKDKKAAQGRGAEKIKTRC